MRLNCSSVTRTASPSSTGPSRNSTEHGAYGVHNARRSTAFGSGFGSTLSTDEQFNSIIDQMGAASAKAQKLPQVITSAGRLFSSDNKVYIRAQGNRCIGFLKSGRRNLFIRNEYGIIKEIRPVCVLDFYVHESMQRGGHGKALFDMMMRHEGAAPEKLAYDRPSEKLLAFLGKHFGLRKYVPQNNNFVVYDQYWDSARPKQS